MTFSTPLDQIYHAIFIQNPAKAYNYKAYTSELSNVAWSAIIFWIIFTSPILFVVARLTRNIHGINETKILVYSCTDVESLMET